MRTTTGEIESGSTYRRFQGLTNNRIIVRARAGRLPRVTGHPCEKANKTTNLHSSALNGAATNRARFNLVTHLLKIYIIPSLAGERGSDTRIQNVQDIAC